MDLSNLTLITPPKIDSDWLRKDYLGALKVRLSIGRNRYQVTPGLYKLGNPGKNAAVIVTSNYKLTFDIVRRDLKGFDAWLLVLQTYGINVWCAAGKGTFGTGELIRQIRESQLHLYVSHKRIIVPQLGAPGVSGFRVKEATGFSVRFGPVRSADLKAYLSAGLKKTDDMRAVRFNLPDRLILTPVEIVNSLKYLLFAIFVVVLISGIHPKGIALSEMRSQGIWSGFYLFTAYFSGAFLTPALLPWLPFRQFAGKGLIAGFVCMGLFALLSGRDLSQMEIIAWFSMSGAIASFLAMNFTGASTYTSLSGVRKEMRIFVPVQLVLFTGGFALFIISQFN